MKKSEAQNLNRILCSSTDDEYPNDSLFQQENLDDEYSDVFETPRVYTATIQQQLSMFKMQDFENSKCSGLPPITDEEYNLSSINTPFLPPSDSIPVPVACMFMMIAGSNRFPRMASEFQKRHPSIFLWRDVRNVLETDFSNYAQNYFKEHYTTIKSRLRFFTQIDPTIEKLNNAITLRRDIPNGRILYHYIGYGFPAIVDSTIPCLDKKTGNFVNYPLKTLFESIKPPAFFVFDCSNAASTIPALEKTTIVKKEEQKNGSPIRERFMTRTIDWTDWFCICATGIGETLPNDPHLPNDFLTSCIFTPVRTAIVCYIIQHYRNTIVTNNFPLDFFNSQLFKSKTISDLEHVLSAIIDGIASDSLPNDLYRLLFRKDTFIELLFKRFLLAQYLLKPYQVHPVSRPSLPDLSMHPLWNHWTMIIDIYIKKTFSLDFNFANSVLFKRTLDSVTGFLKRHQEKEISPSLISILFYYPHDDSLISSVYSILAQYASSSDDSRCILSKTAIFTSFFNEIVSNKLDLNCLHNVLYIVISLIQNNPKFIHEIRKMDFGNFPNKLFDMNTSTQTKSLIAVLIATLVCINESVRMVVVTPQFLGNIKILLETSDTILSIWLILIIRKMFDAYGFEHEFFYNLTLHTQIATFVQHNSYEVRASSLSCLTCMLHQNEDLVNQQLFCLVFITAFDPSFLVRYSFVLFLGKFLTIYKSYIYLSLSNMNMNLNISDINTTFHHQSFSSLICLLFKTDKQNENKPFSFSLISSLASTVTSLEHLVSIAIYLTDLMTNDPHNCVLEAAQKVKAFIIRSAQVKSMSQPSSQAVSPNSLTDFISLPKSNSIAQNINHSTSINNALSRNIISTKRIIDSSTNDMVGENDESYTSNENDGLESNINLPENSGDAVFKICLDQIVNSECWRIKDISHETPISFQQSPLTMIPTTKLTSKSIFKVDLGRPTKIAYHETSLSFCVGTSEGFVVFNDERNKRLTNTSFGSNVTSLNICDFGCDPLVIVGTDEGCISIWDPQQHTPKVTFRADWPPKKSGTCFCYTHQHNNTTISSSCSASSISMVSSNENRQNCSSVSLNKFSSPPLVCALVSNKKQIVSSRGNCGVVRLWDIESQKLISEFSAGAKEAVTAITVNPSSFETCIAGFRNGRIVEIDLRSDCDNDGRRLRNIAAPAPDEEILRIVSNTSNKDQPTFIGSTKNGSCVKWQTLSDYEMISVCENQPLADFDCHLHSPLLVFTPQQSNPIMTDLDGNILHTLKSVGSGAVCAFHPVLPVVAFGNPDGEIISCELTI